MQDLTEYIRVNSYQFQLLRPGDFIRWKTPEGHMSRGATIDRIGKSANRYNWQLTSYNGEFSLYWDKIDHAFVRKPFIYDVLDEKISAISNILLFVVKELELDDRFAEFKKTLRANVTKKEREKMNRVMKKRGKSVPGRNKKMN